MTMDEYIASLPTRERGLKQGTEQMSIEVGRVAPYTGAWIETYEYLLTSLLSRSRSLHGSVD